MADRKEALRQGIQQDHFDRELDAALAKYAAVEPRLGLEERVLASLQAVHIADSRATRWLWCAAGALAVVIVALALVWRSSTLHAPRIATHHGTGAPSVIPSGSPGITEVGTNGAHSHPFQPSARHGKRPMHATATAAANPKLDRFPSPQPLSAQEQILQDYVADYPEQAVLIARARNEALQRDAEEMRASGDTEVDTGR
jgi:hypothetical protein